jgi:hypothetical protein
VGDDRVLHRLGYRATSPLVAEGAVALAFSYAIEISQLYHQPWIDHIRQTTLGHLTLGTTFIWTDLVAYTVGVAVGIIATQRR